MVFRGAHNFIEDEGGIVPFVFKGTFNDDRSVLKVLIHEKATVDTESKISILSDSMNSELVGINKNVRIDKSKIVNDFFDPNKIGFSCELKGSAYPVQLKIFHDRWVNSIKGNGNLFQKNYEENIDFDHIEIQFTDNKIFYTPWQRIELSKGIVTYSDTSVNLKEFKVRLKMTPTFTEMAKGFSKVFKNKTNTTRSSLGDKLSFELNHLGNEIYFESLFDANSDLITENLTDLSIGLVGRFSKIKQGYRAVSQKRAIVPPGFIKKGRDLNVYEVPLVIDANEILKKNKKLIEISPMQKGLILRVINRNAAGIPWVEASLIESDKIAIAKKANRVYLEHKSFLESLNDEVLHTLFLSISKKNDSDDFLHKNYFEENKLGEILNKMKMMFSDDETLNYYLLNGSWYNTSSISFSDAAGYLILKNATLISGEKYTLYLWNESKEEQKPDKEITFQAQDGVTDLGAIVFD